MSLTTILALGELIYKFLSLIIPVVSSVINKPKDQQRQAVQDFHSGVLSVIGTPPGPVDKV